MTELCYLNCLNNGNYVVNISSNTTYCQCEPCYGGIFCQDFLWTKERFNATYVFTFISLIGLCFSILNNSLVLELFICCGRIRRTNCGIYLMVYSIVSFVSNILVAADQLVQYYPNPLINNDKAYRVFRYSIITIGYHVLIRLCILFSSWIAFERSLLIYYDGKMNTNRWRSFAFIIFSFMIAGGSATPMLLYQCDWENESSALHTVREVFFWFYFIAGIILYVVATVLLLISFAYRIRRYGTENSSFIKTFLKLLYTHLFVFVPPIAYITSIIPFTIAYSVKNPTDRFYQCGISTGEFIIKVIFEELQSVPFTITWLLFVYPSKVYMNEYYLNTWSGQYLLKILFLFKSCNNIRR